MNAICTIVTYYSEEKYLIQNVNAIEDIQEKLEEALNNVCFEEEYVIKSIKIVDDDYVNFRQKAIQIYENIFNESVEEGFLQAEFVTLEAILDAIERKTKMNKNEKEMEKAVKLLMPLLKGMAEDRDRHVEVWAETYKGTDKICVEIDKGKYEINVTAMNMRAMIRSVIDTVALKF